MKLTADLIRSYDLEQDFIVDVGVYRGTPWLYDAFPNTPFVLVDPQIADDAVLPRKVAKVVPWAAGARVGRAEMRGRMAMTNLVEGKGAIQVEPLSTMLHDMPGKFGLKVNAEGWDADVIWGLGKRRKDVAWLHVEVPLRSGLFPHSTALDLFRAMGEDDEYCVYFHPYAFFDCPWPHNNYCSALFLPFTDTRLHIAPHPNQIG